MTTTPTTKQHHYTCNGKPLAASYNKLSNVAYFFTAGIESPDSPRIGVKALKELLAKSQITDPDGTVWSFKLPNGVTIASVAGPAPAKASGARTARKGATKAAPAKKAPATKKAPAKKAAKPATTKKATRKAPAKKAAPKAATGTTAKVLPAKVDEALTKASDTAPARHLAAV